MFDLKLLNKKKTFSIFLCGLLIFKLQHGWPIFQWEVAIGWYYAMKEIDLFHNYEIQTKSLFFLFYRIS